jgi:hypothetical protein
MPRANRLLVVLPAVTLMFACGSAPAPAGQFSTPAVLPTPPYAGWAFAVNDRGEAVGAYRSLAGVVVTQIGPQGQLGRSQLVAIPAHAAEPEPSVSVALGETGAVAVGILYGDGRVKPVLEPHGSGPCCDHIAVSSWRRGA